MTWPTLADCVKFVDVSCYNNQDNIASDRTKGRIDWRRFREDNPEVALAIARIAGSGTGADKDFGYNYDEAAKVGLEVAGYVNNNPKKTAASMMKDWWRPTVGDRQPKLVVEDGESTQEIKGTKITAPMRARITSGIRDDLAAIRAEWPGARVLTYTGQWFWSPNVVHGWEGVEDYWCAEYRYFIMNPDGTWRAPVNFEELDRLLPIHNKFTPMDVSGFDPARKRAWQFTEKGKLRMFSVDGRPCRVVDLNYMLRTYFTQVFGGVPSLPPTSPGPLFLDLPDVGKWSIVKDSLVRQGLLDATGAIKS